MAAKEPRPGMGQDEKDRLGRELAEARAQDELVAARAATMARWTPDDVLDTYDKPQLLQEAELRQVEVRTSASKDKIIAALKAARDEAAEVAVPPPPGVAGDNVAGEVDQAAADAQNREEG
jgi:hypothetical protein